MPARKTLFAFVIPCLMVCLGYFGVRAWATRIADREIDAYFKEFRETLGPTQYYRFSDQSPEEINEITSRNETAIMNFAYEDNSPTLNLSLNQTTVEISWHLTFEFEKRYGHWYPIRLDEFEGRENDGA